uniref:Uncharacterized protein n=1 Tax=Anguilla anguilla TaxID=7936 RepID=A0A0E9WYC2_ANGAN
MFFCFYYYLFFFKFFFFTVETMQSFVWTFCPFCKRERHQDHSPRSCCIATLFTKRRCCFTRFKTALCSYS